MKLLEYIHKSKVFTTVEDLYQDMLNKKNDYYNHKIDKYVVSYNILDKEHIEVKSNIGRTRVVTNNKANLKRLDQVIIKNKVQIARKIDEYEAESNVRLFVLLINIILLSLSFASVVGSFFIGNYVLLLCSLMLFTVFISLSLMTGSNYYILVKEIRSLKKITGYKEDSEIDIPKLKDMIKNSKVDA
jgi:lipopolysaccharide export LptBFGC system permease protein LptF